MTDQEKLAAARAALQQAKSDLQAAITKIDNALSQTASGGSTVQPLNPTK